MKNGLKWGEHNMKLNNMDELYLGLDFGKYLTVDDRSRLHDLTKYMLDKIEQKQEDLVPLYKKTNLTVVEMMELAKKGFRLYTYCPEASKMVEITLDNEHEYAGQIKEFLLPMMVEKINERYAEVSKLEAELHQITVKTRNEISELHERIAQIKNNGTDLMI